MMTKLLVVDDDDSIRTSLENYLCRNGYEVVLAQDGNEALAVARKNRPDLVVLDVMLPGMNGYECCRRLKEIDPALPVIFLSAKGDIVDKATGFGQGGDDYITKPFARQELVMRIEAVLRRAMPRPAAMSEKIVLGDLTIFPKNYSVLVGGVEAGIRSTASAGLVSRSGIHPSGHLRGGVGWRLARGRERCGCVHQAYSGEDRAGSATSRAFDHGVGRGIQVGVRLSPSTSPMKKGRCPMWGSGLREFGVAAPGYLQQAGTSCLTRSCSSERLASLKRSSVPTR